MTDDKALLLAATGSCSTWQQADIQREWKFWSEMARDVYRDHREWGLEAGLSREDAARFGAASAVALTTGRFREWFRMEWTPTTERT
jgi:hypothetical protein